MKRNEMIKYFTSILCWLLVLNMFAQVNAGEDLQINEGTPVQLNGIFEGWYGNMIAAWDDGFEGPFPIGFSFSFYGEIFNEVFIGPNGILSFDDDPPTFYQDVPQIPGAEIPKSIMGPFQDLFTRPLDQPHDQYMYYAVTGDAPNRKFVAGWCEAPMYACESFAVSIQIVLEEGTNQIYNHLIVKPPCDAHLDNLATQGLNFNDTIGIAVPGRNRSSWSAINESWQYTYLGNYLYDVEEIDFLPEFVVPEENLKWRWIANEYPGGEVIANEPSKVVAPKETITYFAEVSLCGGVSFYDEILIQVVPIPNAFNPNSQNELNRTFMIPLDHAVEVTGFNLSVFNRWGEMVFTSGDPLFGWDGRNKGKDCQPGVYVWVVSYIADDEKIINQGNITLVR